MKLKITLLLFILIYGFSKQDILANSNLSNLDEVINLEDRTSFDNEKIISIKDAMKASQKAKKATKKALKKQKLINKVMTKLAKKRSNTSGVGIALAIILVGAVLVIIGIAGVGGLLLALGLVILVIGLVVWLISLIA